MDGGAAEGETDDAGVGSYAVDNPLDATTGVESSAADNPLETIANIANRAITACTPRIFKEFGNCRWTLPESKPVFKRLRGWLSLPCSGPQM